MANKEIEKNAVNQEVKVEEEAQAIQATALPEEPKGGVIGFLKKAWKPVAAFFAGVGAKALYDHFSNKGDGNSNDDQAAEETPAE